MRCALVRTIACYVFRGLEEGRWLVPFMACAVIAIIANAILVRAIGFTTLVQRYSTMFGAPSESPSEQAWLSYLAKPFVTLAGDVVFSAILWRASHLLGTRVADGNGMYYRVALAISLYAACAREALRLFLIGAAVIVRRCLGMSLADGLKLRIDLASFLHPPVSRPVLIIASFVDLLTLLFLAFVAFGVARVSPGLPFSRTISAVSLAWVAYATLSKL